MLKTPVLTGIAVFAVLLIIALVLSSWFDRKRQRRIIELKERSRRLHQAELQRQREGIRPPGAPGPEPAPHGPTGKRTA
ncbi:MAG: hypothetical protein U1F98_06290 [Verrucomicrobiota bacterium]